MYELTKKLDYRVRIQDNKGKTALHYAAEHRSFATKVLIIAGSEVGVRDNQGKTALHYAAVEYGSLQTIGALIAAKTDVKVQDNEGKTPLDCANEGGNLEMQVFLKKIETQEEVACKMPGQLDEEQNPFLEKDYEKTSFLVEEPLPGSCDSSHICDEHEYQTI